MVTTVAVVGATGSLGRIICAVADEHPQFEVVSRLNSASPIEAIDGADLVVDATTPAVSESVVLAALDRGARVLVATSGWSSDRIPALRKAASEAESGVLVVPNFSLGSVVGTALAAAAGRFFSSVEIVETHRDTKVDSPSGTAVRTAELIAGRRAEPVEAPHVDQRARGQQVASIPVHALRRPGVHARQEVFFSGPGETLSITHDTSDPAAAYAPGIRIALEALRTIDGVVVGLEHILDLGLASGSDPA